MSATLVGIALVGTIFGIIGLYWSGACFRWSGKLLGGHASPAEIRAALAWGQLPIALGVVLCLAVLGAMKLGVGYVPFDHLVGRAALIFMSVVRAGENGESRVDLGRFGAVR